MSRGADRSALVHGIARITLALAWVSHGFWPKLWGPHPDEISMVLAHGIDEGRRSR